MIALHVCLLSLVKLGSRTPEKAVSFAPLPKIARQKRAKSSITQPWIIQFRSNFVQSLNTRHPKCRKFKVSSKVKVTA